MAHKCTHVQNGHQVCSVHMLTKAGLRYRFRKQIQDVIEFDQLKDWHELMEITMLPKDDMVPLDDRPHAYIEKIARGGVAT